MEIFTYCFLFLLTLFFFFFFLRRFPSNGVVGCKSYPIVGCLPEMIKNRHRILDWTVEILSRCPTQTTVLWQPGNRHIVMTANPENVEYIVKTRFEDFPKGEWLPSHLEDFLGQGIFNTDGELWWKQRKIASYEFSTRSLRDFVMNNAIVEVNTRLIPALQNAATSGKSIDLQNIFERFAFDNILKLAFNVDLACLSDEETAGTEFMHAFKTAVSIISQRVFSIVTYSWKIKRKLNIGSEKLLRKSILTVHKFADEIVRTRIEGRSINTNEDLLSRFINTKELNSPEMLRDIVISIILAGQDTTSSVLAWFFWLISTHPEVEHKILQELKSLRSQNGKKLEDHYGFEDLKQMNYLHAAITETLRLYPPVALDTRTCGSDQMLPDGTFVRKGWEILYNGYAMGRMESIWGKDCDGFKPERWIDENGVFRGENCYKFPAFHGGPRMCIGKEMGYIQMKLVVAGVLEKFVVDVLGKEKRPEMLLSVTLRVKGGLLVKVQERN